MTSLLARIEHFWFSPVSSKGFGLMRVCFGLVAFIAFLWQWNDVAYYYSDLGMLPRSEIPMFLRGELRFSILNHVGGPTEVFLIYLVLLTCLALTTLGVFTRPAVIIATLLIFSFHERNPALLAGGDTVLRHIGFVLMLAPCHRSFSVWSLKKRLHAWLRGKRDPQQSIARMPIWPYRLLLWQFAIIYVASLWTKLIGAMWRDGSAVEVTLRHEHFLRFDPLTVAPLQNMGWIVDYFTLTAQGTWLVVLAGPIVLWFLPRARAALSPIVWLRIAILSNALVHLMIFVLMDVGIFSLILFTGYIGLLREEDFAALRRLFNHGHEGRIAVLYDGHCGLCLRSVFVLTVLDWLRRLDIIDFRDAGLRRKAAPGIALKHLDRALHIILPDGSVRTGFAAFRALAWHLPPLWIIAPLLYIPGVKTVGDAVYARVAESREKCTHEECRI